MVNRKSPEGLSRSKAIASPARLSFAKSRPATDRQAQKGGRITHRHFVQATGRKPIQDDLERSNCPKAGQIGHFCCGWNWEADLPQFDIGARFDKVANAALAK